jgi:hypothetical protein
VVEPSVVDPSVVDPSAVNLSAVDLNAVDLNLAAIINAAIRIMGGSAKVSTRAFRGRREDTVARNVSAIAFKSGL